MATVATVAVCHCLESHLKRLKFPNVDVSQSVRDFKKIVTREISKTNSEIVVVYCGLHLDDSQTLNASGIQNGSTVYVFETAPTKNNDSVMDASIEKTVLSALKSTLAKPANKSRIMRILHTTGTLENLIEAAPGLDTDPVALAMLRDPSLMATVCKPENLKKVLEKHPSFGHACLYLASEVKADIVASGQPSVYAGSYSLDEMSDDEDSPAPHLARRTDEANAQITNTQLLAALASAQSATPSPTTPTAARSSSRTMVTSAAFQDAMRQAQNPATPPSSRPTPISRPDPTQALQSQLAQMRDMGITDEAVARQALVATGGNIQAALELIFGGYTEDM